MSQNLRHRQTIAESALPSTKKLCLQQGRMMCGDWAEFQGRAEVSDWRWSGLVAADQDITKGAGRSGQTPSRSIVDQACIPNRISPREIRASPPRWPHRVPGQEEYGPSLPKVEIVLEAARWLRTGRGGASLQNGMYRRRGGSGQPERKIVSRSHLFFPDSSQIYTKRAERST